MSQKNLIDITPATKVAELLSAYPQLEAVLMDLSPAFARLRNPVLRRTVARVTTLQQASRVAGIPLGQAINRLRTAAGLQAVENLQDSVESSAAEPPEWVKSARIRQSLDVSLLLEEGQKPVARVLGELQSLQEGEVYELIAPFFPAPLVDLAKEKGFECWHKTEGERTRVLFRKAG